MKVDTQLSGPQEKTLQKLENLEPEPVVIGWHVPNRGPLMIFTDGRWLVVRRTGRVVELVTKP